MNKSKFNIKGYFKPTPKTFRKLGDALLASSTLISTYAISEDMKCLAITTLMIGAIGKFATNFFSE